MDFSVICFPAFISIGTCVSISIVKGLYPEWHCWSVLTWAFNSCPAFPQCLCWLWRDAGGPSVLVSFFPRSQCYHCFRMHGFYIWTLHLITFHVFYVVFNLKLFISKQPMCWLQLCVLLLIGLWGLSSPRTALAFLKTKADVNQLSYLPRNCYSLRSLWCESWKHFLEPLSYT